MYIYKYWFSRASSGQIVLEAVEKIEGITTASALVGKIWLASLGGKCVQKNPLRAIFESKSDHRRQGR